MLNVLRTIFMSLVVFIFISCGGGGGSSDNSTNVDNQLPNAKATYSIEGTLVTLDASTSTDADGKIVKYEWYEGENLLGSGKTFSKSDFSKGKHTITLKITDDDGEVSQSVITFVIVSKQLTANIQAPTSAQVGSNVTFDASDSVGDNEIVKYEWYENDTLLGNDKTYTTSSLSIGVHTIKLIVTDDDGLSAKDEANITITQKPTTPNKAPTANAGDNQTAQEGTSITLDASKSKDADGTITKYEWYEGTTLLGSEKTLTKDDFNVSVHTITLKVTDNDGATDTDEVKVAITKEEPENKIPTANAGEDQNATEGTSITLDANASKDADGTITKYEWYEGSTLLGSGKTLTKDDFGVSVHTVTLKVTDNSGATDTDEVKVTITEDTSDTTPPTAEISPADTSTDVALDSDITIKFSEEMNASTLTSTNITLTRGGVEIAYAQTQSGNVLTLKPTNIFGFNESYTIALQNLEDMAGNKINPTIATFATSNLNLSILKTGQTASFIANDDGAYGKGVARNYSKIDINSTASIVKDNVTGLEWQNEYSADMNWTKANEYCTNLTLNGYSDWRLPSILEISTLTDFGKQNPALDAKFNFLFTFNELYHSATSVPSYDAYQMTFRPGLGHIHYHLKKNEKKVMCVRGEQMPSLKCYRKDESKTIICSNGLMWQDDESAKINEKNWSQAIEYCENLDFANYSDWRLPNINELKSIVDYHKLPSFNSSFKNMAAGNNDKYWSSTNSVFGTDIHAWYVRFSLGVTHVKNKTNAYYVRCVR